MGLCLFNLGDYDEAIVCFTQSIRENYEFPRSLNNLGNCLRKKDQLVKAINCYEQAIRVHNYLREKGLKKESFHIAHLNLATALVETGNFLSAVEHINLAQEGNHSTIVKAVKDKGLDYFCQHKHTAFAIAAVESKDF